MANIQSLNWITWVYVEYELVWTLWRDVALLADAFLCADASRKGIKFVFAYQRGAIVFPSFLSGEKKTYPFTNFVTTTRG